MPFTVMLSIVLIGAGGASAGVVGLISPKGQRMDAFLSLVLGAGVGVAALAIGTWASGPQNATDQQQHVLLYACLAGFVAVIAGLVLLRARARAAPLTQEPGRPDPSRSRSPFDIR